jgi:hypothetical protein
MFDFIAVFDTQHHYPQKYNGLNSEEGNPVSELESLLTGSYQKCASILQC